MGILPLQKENQRLSLGTELGNRGVAERGFKWCSCLGGENV